MTDHDITTALVVDDNPNMRTILAALLKAAGVEEVRQACDGQEAFGIVARWRPSFLVIDQHMEPMNGRDFALGLRGDRSNPNAQAPIIMLTAHTERAIVESARDAGIDEVLAKPVSTKALMRRLHAIFYERRPFVDTRAYIGPDRRRRCDPAYKGPLRRASEQDKDYFALD